MYETGVLVALLLWAYNAIMLIVLLNSQAARNLRRIGMRFSWLDLAPKRLTRAELARGALWSVGKFALVHCVSLFFIVLSWVYVAIAIGTFVYRRQKDAGKPLAMREFLWKIRNVDLPFEQLAKELYALHGVLGLEASTTFEQFRDDLWANTTTGA